MCGTWAFRRTQPAAPKSPGAAHNSGPAPTHTAPSAGRGRAARTAEAAAGVLGGALRLVHWALLVHQLIPGAHERGRPAERDGEDRERGVAIRWRQPVGAAPARRNRARPPRRRTPGKRTLPVEQREVAAAHVRLKDAEHVHELVLCEPRAGGAAERRDAEPSAAERLQAPSSRHARASPARSRARQHTQGY